jgi:predicted nucleic-acid-binding Zn-ribbon protein
MKNGVCIKCNSNNIVQVRPLDRAHHNSKRTLEVATYENPNAWIFKGESSYELIGYSCGECGYVEFYLSNPLN